MTMCARPRFSMLRMPGWPALLALPLGLGVIVGGLMLSSHLQRGSTAANIAEWCSIALGLIFFWAMVAWDKHRYYDRVGRRLAEIGISFHETDHESMEFDWLEPLEWMVPTPIGSRSVERWGWIEGAIRETVIGAATTGSGKSEIPWVFVAVRIDPNVPSFMIGRKKFIAPKRVVRVHVEDRKFAKSRSLWTAEECPDPDSVRRVVEATDSAFLPPKLRGRSFRLAEVPGMHEQWASAGAWLAYTERGTLKPAPLLDAIELVSEVADRVEAAAIGA